MIALLTPEVRLQNKPIRVIDSVLQKIHRVLALSTIMVYRYIKYRK